MYHRPARFCINDDRAQPSQKGQSWSSRKMPSTASTRAITAWLGPVFRTINLSFQNLPLGPVTPGDVFISFTNRLEMPLAETDLHRQIWRPSSPRNAGSFSSPVVSDSGLHQPRLLPLQSILPVQPASLQCMDMHLTQVSHGR